MPSFEMVDGPDGRPMLTEVRVIGVSSNVPLASEIDPELPYDAQWLQAAGWNPWNGEGRRAAGAATRGPASSHSGQRAADVNGSRTAEGSPPADPDVYWQDRCDVCGMKGTHWKGCTDA